MNTSKTSEPAPQWNYQWNHMALPTFGFIFALPEPPPDLQLPVQHQAAVESPPSNPATSVQPKSEVDEATVKSEPAEKSLAMVHLQSRRQRKSDKPEWDKGLKQRSQPHPKPVLAFPRGNSDPFSAAGITVTSQINQVLTFARDICLPAFYFVDSLRDSSVSAESSRDVANSSGWISSPAARLGWQQVVDALSDKCTALACLSTYLALMAACNINPAKATEASLKMRAGSSALLRQRLLRHESQKSDVETYRELLWQVFWHFYAEFFAGNMVAAQIHGKMLRQSCETAEEGVITEHFLDSVIFVDFHMSAKYMTNTVLDIETWVPEVFASTWDKIDPYVAEITHETGEHLHTSVMTEPLRSIFLRTRQALILLQHSQEAQSYDIDLETLYYWHNSHSYVDSGTLISTYLQLVEQSMSPQSTSQSSSRTSRSSPDSLGTIYTRAALCLAALYAVRDIGHEIRINGIDIVDASTAIVKHLKETIEQARIHSTSDEIREYRLAHLWCAFIGAMSEQRLALPGRTEPQPVPDPRKRMPGSSRSASLQVHPRNLTQFSIVDPSNMHFNHLLADMAHSMGLLSWQQVSDILKQFIYTDSSEPHGNRWFWKTMGAYLDRKRKAAREEQERRQKQAREMSRESDSGNSTPTGGGLIPQGQMGEHRRWSRVDMRTRSTPTRTEGQAGEKRTWNIMRTQSHGERERQGYG